MNRESHCLPLFYGILSLPLLVSPNPLPLGVSEPPGEGGLGQLTTPVPEEVELRPDLSRQALRTAGATRSFPKGLRGLIPSPMPAALFVFCTKSRRAERYWQKTLLQMEEMESQIREEIRKGNGWGPCRTAGLGFPNWGMGVRSAHLSLPVTRLC